jgi:hypothetical protein
MTFCCGVLLSYAGRRTVGTGDRTLLLVALHERNLDQSSEFAEASQPRGP